MHGGRATVSWFHRASMSLERPSCFTLHVRSGLSHFFLSDAKFLRRALFFVSYMLDHQPIPTGAIFAATASPGTAASVSASTSSSSESELSAAIACMPLMGLLQQMARFFRAASSAAVGTEDSDAPPIADQEVQERVRTRMFPETVCVEFECSLCLACVDLFAP